MRLHRRRVPSHGQRSWSTSEAGDEIIDTPTSIISHMICAQFVGVSKPLIVNFGYHQCWSWPMILLITVSSLVYQQIRLSPAAWVSRVMQLFTLCHDCFLTSTTSTILHPHDAAGQRSRWIMSTDGRGLDPHAKVPQELRTVFKRYQRLKGRALDNDEDVFDLEKGLSKEQRGRTREGEFWDLVSLERVFRRFGSGTDQEKLLVERSRSKIDFVDVPGKRKRDADSLCTDTRYPSTQHIIFHYLISGRTLHCSLTHSATSSTGSPVNSSSSRSEQSPAQNQCPLASSRSISIRFRIFLLAFER